VQAAINGLPAGSIIRICAGTYVGNVTVSKNLTLLGAGEGSDPASNTILDANGNGSPVTIPAGVTATVQGVRITGASGIVASGVTNNGTLTMRDCTVTGNESTANNSGGGLRNGNGASLTMTTCTVSGNTAGRDGGGILTLSGSLSMTACTVSDNTAGGLGGGIACNGSGTTQLLGCVIGPGNMALQGGGLSVFNGASVTLDASFVFGNEATDAGSPGGGIRNSNSTVTLQHGSTVSDNDPDNCVATGSGTITGDGCAP
jgi:hypothetical protein